MVKGKHDLAQIEKQPNYAADLLNEMESTAARMRDLIVAMPAEELLGYIYAKFMMKAMRDHSAGPALHDGDGPDDAISENQFLLEYVHAVLASHAAPSDIEFHEEQCVELFELSRKLMAQALAFAMATTAPTKNGLFGPDTADIEFRAKSTWLLLRGNRYQVLEGEFYRYVLETHEEVLKEIYGIDASDIATGFQDISDATRSGQADALKEMMKQFVAFQTFASEQKKPHEEAMKMWSSANADQSKAAGLAMDDFFRGGISNVSRHTELPAKLLADLAYERGEEGEFFAAGDYAGTPFRTLPARKKPLIQLGSDYYAVDPSFTRDAGYRALLYNLLQRKPDYKKEFEHRQKVMSEGAFSGILASQLTGATIYQEVYYKDSVSKQWSENDTLILIDDVLFLVEAKAGAAATIASPALDFERHAQSVQDLVLKAYTQCDRFFKYLDSADEVPIYHRLAGKYIECGRIRRSDYRVMVPIGLTIESFSPFAAYCKELPQVEPILGKHAFISMSIDSLFVLKRFLTTPGEFTHYIEVRQAVAGMRRAHLFDEFEHLGAYITRNRFDQDIAVQLKNDNVDMLVWDRMSDIVDSSFEGEDWESKPVPTQEFPDEVLKLLGALNGTQAPGWLLVESHIRNFGEKTRKDFSKILSDLRKTLDLHPARYFTILGDQQPLFIWMQGGENVIEWNKVNEKASASALSTNSPGTIGLLVGASVDGTYNFAHRFPIYFPSNRTEENAHIFDDSERMSQPNRAVNLRSETKLSKPKKARKLGRNEPCPCGSGSKYKKCCIGSTAAP